MGKWTRRGLITAGVVTGGALAVGVALRPGHRVPELKGLVTTQGETLVTAWVKIDVDNTVTAIVPHSEMGQGAQTALMQMLADELDAAWEDVRFMEAPAEDEYANWQLGKGFLFGDAELPSYLVPSLDGAMMQIAKTMRLQTTGGSLSVRATGVTGVRVAGAATRELLLQAAASEWGVPVAEVTAENTHLHHSATGQSAPFAQFASAAAELTPSSSPRQPRRAAVSPKKSRNLPRK